MKFKSNIEVQAGIEDKDGQVGSNGQILASTGSQVDWIDPANIVTSATDVIIECKNTSGVTIAKGTPVYQTGNVGATAVIEVAVADASDEDKMAAIGLLQSDLINNAFGYVVVTGELLNITTSPIDGVTPTIGDTIYVKPGGGLTLTKPTGVNFIQNVGLVGKVSGGNAGSLTVSSIMRSNDVPTPLYIDHDNQILGIGTTSPSVYHKLDVNGSANFSTDIVVGRNATALSFDMNPAYDSGNYYLNLHKNQSNDGGVLLYSKPTSGSAQLDWQIVNQGTTGDLKFYAAGLAGNALVLDRETGNLQLPEYGAGTLVSDASGNITVSSGGGAGGPYLPLSAGTSFPLTGDLYQTMGAIGVAQTDQDYIAKIYELNSDGFMSLYTGQPTPLERIRISSYGDSFFVPANNGNVGIGTTSPDYKLDIGGTAASTDNTVRLMQNNGGTAIRIGSGGGSSDVVLLRIDGNSATGGHDGATDSSNYGFSFKYFGTGGGNNNRFGILSDNQVAATQVEAITILQDGFIGIGNTAPGYKLDVTGSVQSYISATRYIRLQGASADFEVVSDNNTKPVSRITGTGTADLFQIFDNTTEVFTVLDGGNVGIGTTSPSDILQVNQGSDAFRGITIEGTSPALYLKDTQATNAYHIGSNGNYLYFLEDSNQSGGYNNIMAFWDPSNNFIFSLGNVGIGTSNPSQKLHVAGNARVTGAYYDSNNSPGTANQVLVSTVTGTDWIDGSAIPGVPAGSGTLNTVAMWTPDGDTLGDSRFTQTSTSNQAKAPAGSGTKSFEALDSSGNSDFHVLGTGEVIIPSNYLFVSASQGAYFTGNLRARGGISNDLGTLQLLDNTNVTGDLTVVGDIITGAALLSNQENTDVDTGTETVASVAIATYTAAFFDFVIKKTTNVRSGTVYACHDGTNVEFTETSTQDLGDTSDVTLSVDISGGNMRLRATTTSDDWSVKSLIRAI